MGLRARLARDLTKLTKGEIHVRFTAEELRDDPGSIGHLFVGWHVHNTSFDEVTLNDRLPDLRGQLASELRRIAQRYIEFAGMVDPRPAKARKGGAA